MPLDQNKKGRPIMQQAKTASGNVLFLILIAVALFAALSYAVTQSSKTGGNGISKDKAKILAAELVQYATQMEQTITRLRVINNCTNAQISFENPVVGIYVNAGAPSDKRCHVFDVAGGGLSWQDPPKNVNDGSVYFFTGRDYVAGIGSSCPAEQCTDLVVRVSNMSTEVCQAIMHKMNAMPPNAVVPPETDGSHSSTPFTGSYVRQDEIAGANINGNATGCYSRIGGTLNYFYHVLISR